MSQRIDQTRRTCRKAGSGPDLATWKSSVQSSRCQAPTVLLQMQDATLARAIDRSAQCQEMPGGVTEVDMMRWGADVTAG